MKYKILVMLMSFLISTALIGEEKKYNSPLCSDPESLTPSNAALFFKVTKISKAVDFLNSKRDSNNIGSLLQKNIKWMRSQIR